MYWLRKRQIKYKNFFFVYPSTNAQCFSPTQMHAHTDKHFHLCSHSQLCTPAVRSVPLSLPPACTVHLSLSLSVCRCVYGSYSYYRFGLLSVIPDFDSSDTVCNKQCVCGFMLFILTFPYTAEDEGRKGEEEVVRRTIYIIISFKPCHNAIA